MSGLGTATGDGHRGRGGRTSLVFSLEPIFLKISDRMSLTLALDIRSSWNKADVKPSEVTWGGCACTRTCAASPRAAPTSRSCGGWSV